MGMTYQHQRFGMWCRRVDDLGGVCRGMRYPDGGGLTRGAGPAGAGAAGGGGDDRGRGQRRGGGEAVAGVADVGEPLAAGPGGRRAGGAGLQRAGRGEVQARAAEVRELEAVLDAGPAACGYADQCWTLARVADQVWQRFGVEYTLAGVHVLLHRLGWSVQVPARRAAERDEAAVAAWKQQTWPS